MKRLWYSEGMWGFSKKRFLITFILSLFILVITGLIQLFDTEEWNFLLLEGTSCTGTGYPVAVCLSNTSSGLLFSISLVNIIFWFGVINILYSLKQIKIGLLSLIIWVGSVIVQKQYGLVHCISGNPSWCKITGYPISECVNRDEKVIVFAVYLTNIAFWFLAIKLIQKTLIGIKKRVL